MFKQVIVPEESHGKARLGTCPYAAKEKRETVTEE